MRPFAEGVHITVFLGCVCDTEKWLYRRNLVISHEKVVSKNIYKNVNVLLSACLLWPMTKPYAVISCPSSQPTSPLQSIHKRQVSYTQYFSSVSSLLLKTHPYLRCHISPYSLSVIYSI